MTVTILQGDARERLRELDPESVHCCISSPPYWGLRDYKLAPLVWGGKRDCKHEWGKKRIYIEGGGGAGSSSEAFSKPGPENAERIKRARWREHAFCRRCGAWRGSLGLEPTPDLYVAHIVEVFRPVKRVLRKDGVVWLNLADSYAGSWGNQGRQKTRGEQRAINKRMLQQVQDGRYPAHASKTGKIPKGSYLKPKDLCEIPSDVVRALRADGWWLRARLPWVKPNGMPDSTKDRPGANSVEYVFLLTKSGTPTFWTHRDHAGTRKRPKPDYRWIDALTGEETDQEPENWRTVMVDGKRRWSRLNLWRGHDYFYDDVAVMKQAVALKEHDFTGQRYEAPGQPPQTGTRPRKSDKQRGHSRRHAGSNDRWDNMSKAEQQSFGCQFRNCDLFYESLEGAHGLISNGDGEPIALDVATAPFKEAHFATFSPKLVEPMIKVGTSEKGCCPECGAPWVRVTKKTFVKLANRRQGRKAHQGEMADINAAEAMGYNTTRTTGWRPGCAHAEALAKACTVLDPFCGSGTVGLVADRLGRDAVLIDQSPEYCEMARKRLEGDAPLLVDLASPAAARNATQGYAKAGVG